MVLGNIKTLAIGAAVVALYFIYKSAGGGTGIGERLGIGIGSGIGGFGLGTVSGFQRGFAPFSSFLGNLFEGGNPNTPSQTRMLPRANTPGNQRRESVFDPNTETGRIYPVTVGGDTIFVSREARDYYLGL